MRSMNEESPERGRRGSREVGAVPVVAELQPLAPTKTFPPLGIGEVHAPAWLNKPLGRVVDAAGWALVACRWRSA